MANQGTNHIGTGLKGLLSLSLNTFFMFVSPPNLFDFFLVLLLFGSTPDILVKSSLTYDNNNWSQQMSWKSDFEMVYIHVYLLFNSSHFLYPLYLKHFVYFIALVHIRYAKLVVSFEVLQQCDAGTWVLCVSRCRVMYHFILQSPYLYMTTNMFCICIVLIWVLWMSFIFDLTCSAYPGMATRFFPACTFFTFLQWYICQQTTMGCWMLLENSPWGFSFFFICNFSIK